MKKLFLSSVLALSFLGIVPAATAQSPYLAPYELSGSCSVQYDNGPRQPAPWSECYYDNGAPQAGVMVTTGPRGTTALKRYVTMASRPNPGYNQGQYANYPPAYGNGYPGQNYGGQPMVAPQYPRGQAQDPATAILGFVLREGWDYCKMSLAFRGKC